MIKSSPLYHCNISGGYLCHCVDSMFLHVISIEAVRHFLDDWHDSALVTESKNVPQWALHKSCISFPITVFNNYQTLQQPRDDYFMRL